MTDDVHDSVRQCQSDSSLSALQDYLADTGRDGPEAALITSDASSPTSPGLGEVATEPGVMPAVYGQSCSRLLKSLENSRRLIGRLSFWRRFCGLPPQLPCFSGRCTPARVDLPRPWPNLDLRSELRPAGMGFHEGLRPPSLHESAVGRTAACRMARSSMSEVVSLTKQNSF